MPQPQTNTSRPDPSATSASPQTSATASSLKTLGSAEPRATVAPAEAVRSLRFSASLPGPSGSREPSNETAAHGAAVPLDEALSTPISDSSRLKIGELARRTGKTVRALHLYEELGLLRPARSEGGFRLYGPDELARVYWIGKLQDMGFKLQQIQGLLAAISREDPAPASMERVQTLFHGRIEQTRKQLRKLMQLERDLSEAISYLDDCRSCPEVDPASEACAECGQSPSRTAPELVAGIYLKTTDTRVVLGRARAETGDPSPEPVSRAGARVYGDGDLSSMGDREDDDL